MVQPCISAISPSIDTKKTWKNSYRFTDKPKDKFLNWCVAMEDAIDGTIGVDFVYYIPGIAPSATEGNLYYDSGLNALVLRTASAWVTLEAGGDFASLDEAYNGGAGITVDNGAVTMTAPNANDNVALAIVQSDSGTTVAMTLTNAGTGNTIDIQGSGGDDIEGTDDTWTVSSAGLSAFVGLTVGAEDIELENGGEIQNVVDTELRFMENSEDFILDFTTDGITTKSGTGVVAINWGDIDAFTGLASLAGDAGADFALSAANSGTFNFTIAQAGTGDNELRLTSAGTAANAIALTTATGGQTFTAATSIIGTSAAGVISFTSTGGDITIDASDKSVIIDGGEAVTDAINIDSATGGLDVDVALSISLKSTENTADSIEIVSTAGGIDITAAGGSAEDIDIVNSAGSINITASENSADALIIKTDGGTSETINIFSDKGVGASATTEHDASVQLHSDDGGISLYTTANVANAVRIETNGGVDEFITINNLQGTGSDAITISANAAGGNVNVQSILGSILIKAEEDAADAILIEVDGVNSTTMRLIATTGTSVTEDAAAITINAAAGGINIQSDANLDDAIVIRVDGGTTSEMTITNDQGNTTDSIEIASAAGGVLLNAALAVSVVNAFNMDIVVLPTTSPLTILANNSGQVHMMPDTAQDTTFNLPAEADNLHYKFIYTGAAADTSDWIITSGDNAEQFVGGVVVHDEDGELTAAVYSNGSTNSKFNVFTPEAGTVVEMWYDLATTSWYITGTVISKTATGASFADQ